MNKLLLIVLCALFSVPVDILCNDSTYLYTLILKDSETVEYRVKMESRDICLDSLSKSRVEGNNKSTMIMFCAGVEYEHNSKGTWLLNSHESVANDNKFFYYKRKK